MCHQIQLTSFLFLKIDASVRKVSNLKVSLFKSKKIIFSFLRDGKIQETNIQGEKRS